MDRLKAWFTPEMVVAVVAGMFAGVAAVAQCVELAEGHGYYAGWLWGPLEWFRGRAVQLLVVAILLGLWSALWNWRGTWKQWIRKSYVAALRRAAQPVRDEVAAGIPSERTHSYGGSNERFSKAVRWMDGSELFLLEAILDRYDPEQEGSVAVMLNSVAYFTTGSVTLYIGRRMAENACEGLTRRKLLSHWQCTEVGDDFCVEVHLGPLVAAENLQELREWVGTQAAERVRTLRG